MKDKVIAIIIRGLLNLFKDLDKEYCTCLDEPKYKSGDIINNENTEPVVIGSTQEFIVPTPPPVALEPAPPAPPSSNKELDSAGHSWDERIHATTKTKMKNSGEWKLKKGVDKNLVNNILAEQDAVPALPDSTKEPIIPAPPPVVHEPTPPAPPPVAKNLEASPEDWANLISSITTGAVPMTAINAALNKLNYKVIGDLKTNPDSIPLFRQELMLNGYTC